MTTTLVVLLIITLAALIFLPFSKALMKDRQELESNPMEQKFNILISRINKLLMGGAGEIIKTSIRAITALLNILLKTSKIDCENERGFY